MVAFNVCVVSVATMMVVGCNGLALTKSGGWYMEMAGRLSW